MSRLLHALALLALILLAVLSLDARLAGVWADDVADCYKGRGDTVIRGCSRIIKSKRAYGKPISKKNLVSAYHNRGIVYQKKGKYDRASADFDTVIKLTPKQASAYYNRGNTYYDKGQYDKAIADYDKAIKFNPKLASAYNNRGIAYNKKGKYDRAIADFDKAIKLNPKLAAAYTNRDDAYKSKDGFNIFIIRDTEIKSLVTKYYKLIFKEAFLKTNKLNVYLVHGDGIIDLFLVNNRTLFLTTSALLRTKTPNQLIGLIAHEVGDL